jgi:hypothetical protein
MEAWLSGAGTTEGTITPVAEGDARVEIESFLALLRGHGMDNREENELGDLISGSYLLSAEPDVMHVDKNLTLIPAINHTSSQIEIFVCSYARLIAAHENKPMRDLKDESGLEPGAFAWGDVHNGILPLGAEKHIQSSVRWVGSNGHLDVVTYSCEWKSHGFLSLLFLPSPKRRAVTATITPMPRMRAGMAQRGAVIHHQDHPMTPVSFSTKKMKKRIIKVPTPP